MRTLVNTRTGEAQPFEETQIQGAVFSGDWSPEPGSDIQMLTPEGEPVWAKGEDTASMLRGGYTYETEDQRIQSLREARDERDYGNTAYQIATGLQSFASEMTFGLSDVIATKGFGVDPELIKTMNRVNPAAATAGTIAGIAAPLLSVVGAPIIGAGKAAFGVAKAGVKGVLKRGAFKPLAKEALEAGFQYAAKPAGGFAQAALAPYKALDVPGKAISTILGNKLPKGIAKDVIEASIRTGSEGLLYQLGHNMSYASIYKPEMTSEIITKDLGFTALLSAGFGGGSVLGMRAMGAAKRQAEKGFKKMYESSQFGKDLKEQVIKSGGNPNNFDDAWNGAEVIATRAETDLGSAMNKWTKSKAGEAAAEASNITGARLSERMDDLIERQRGLMKRGKTIPGAEKHMDELLTYKNMLENYTPDAYDLDDLWKLRSNADKLSVSPNVDDRMKGIWKDWRQGIDGEIKSMLEKIEPGASNQYQLFKDKVTAGRSAPAAMENDLIGWGKGKVVGMMSDQVMGRVVGGVVGGLPGFLIGGAVSKGIKSMATKYGPRMMANIYKQIEHGNIQYINMTKKAVNNFFIKPVRASRPIVMEKAMKFPNDAEYYATELQELKQNQEAMIDNIYETQQPVADLAPEIFDGMYDTYFKGLNFLEQNLPPNDAPTAIRKYQRFHQAVTNPNSIIENLNNGYISTEESQVLKNIYPNMFQDLGERMLDKYLEAEDKVPYEKELILSRIFDVPLRNTMAKSNVQLLQQGSASEAAEQQQGREGGVDVPVGRPGMQRRMSITQAKRRHIATRRMASSSDRISDTGIGET